MGTAAAATEGVVDVPVRFVGDDRRIMNPWSNRPARQAHDRSYGPRISGAPRLLVEGAVGRHPPSHSSDKDDRNDDEVPAPGSVDSMLR